MVARMMKWRWLPSSSRKYEVKLVVRRIDGLDQKKLSSSDKLSVEIKWKGQKSSLGSLTRTVKKNFTEEVDFASSVNRKDTDSVVWNEEFTNVCSLTTSNSNAFGSWKIAFSLLNGASKGTKKKVPAIGAATLDLADYASTAKQKQFELSLPLVLVSSSTELRPVLRISVSLLELRTDPETTAAVMPFQSPTSSGELVSNEKDEHSGIKASLSKAKIFRSFTGAKKAYVEGESSDGRFSSRSDTDSLGESAMGDSEEVNEDTSIRSSLNYSTLAFANLVGLSFYSSRIVNTDESCVYYSNRNLKVYSSDADDSIPTLLPTLLESKPSILPWKKRRKLNFLSLKAKEETLLKPHYGEDGGDDIDYDRRQLSSDESPGWHSSTTSSSVSEFGDDNFEVGRWETKEIKSRDGRIKVQTQVFFASIDQRSERAAGESACTALVAVIANWFQVHCDFMPIKSQFDSLIREGSLEWRNLCDNEIYMNQFPDKHFDLETVLQANLRPLSVVPGKSFIGFFHPEGMDNGEFGFLHGAMSFDNIWDEISTATECLSYNKPQVYIVSWNDHFFILKVESDAYYLIDTLGERLYEGCNQAYILKFDSNTVIQQLREAGQTVDEKTSSNKQKSKKRKANSKTKASVSGELTAKAEGDAKSEEEWDVACQGKECCKEYMKSFLAAIPIRELQADIKKGLSVSVPHHHRLQIEFHYTKYELPLTETETEWTAVSSVDPPVVDIASNLETNCKC